mgnify:CR=1 FL=1
MTDTMRAAVIPEAGADFELVERPIPDPDPTEVRVAVDACGVCHSDVFVAEGTFPGVSYPRTPGHEVVGRVDVGRPDGYEVVDSSGRDVDSVDAHTRTTGQMLKEVTKRASHGSGADHCAKSGGAWHVVGARRETRTHARVGPCVLYYGLAC